MSKHSTNFTKAFGCMYPVVLAPMSGISGSKLASAVANAGGIGFVGTGGETRLTQLHFLRIGEIAKKLVQAQNWSNDRSKIGVGFVVDGQLNVDPTILNQIITLSPVNVWITGDDYKVYLDIVKNAREHYQPLRSFVQVRGIESVQTACAHGADVIIVKGSRADGIRSISNTTGDTYANTEGLPLDVLIPLARNIISNRSSFEDSSVKTPLLVAAGGIHTAEDVQSMLNLGADAVCLGSRLAMARESDLAVPIKLEIRDHIHQYRPHCKVSDTEVGRLDELPPSSVRLEQLQTEEDEPMFGALEHPDDNESSLPTAAAIIRSLFRE